MWHRRLTRRGLLTASALGLVACAQSPVIGSSAPNVNQSLDPVRDAFLRTAGTWRGLDEGIANQLRYYAGFIGRPNPLDGRSGLARGLTEPTQGDTDRTTALSALAELRGQVAAKVRAAQSDSTTSYVRLWASLSVTLQATHDVASDPAWSGPPAELGRFIPWDAPADGPEIAAATSDSLYLLRKLVTASIGLGGGGVSDVLTTALARIDLELAELTLSGVEHSDPLPSGLPVATRQGLAGDIAGTITHATATTREYWIRSATVDPARTDVALKNATQWDVLVRRLGTPTTYWPGWQQ